MFLFNWPIIIAVTITLYILTIISLPFSAVAATIFLFSLIAFWSRLPGFCIYEPVRIMYMMDFVDIFAVIVALYVGPFHGALFALIWNIVPWFCGGGWMTLIGTVKDATSQAVICLFVPLIGLMVGGDLLLVVTLFTLIRLPLFFLLSFIMPHRSLPAQIFHLTVGGIAVLIVNAFYAKFFGNFFTSLLYKGAAFSWTLFFIATIVIIIFSVTVFGISPKKVGKRIGKQIVHMTKKKQSKPKVNHEDMDDLKKAI